MTRAIRRGLESALISLDAAVVGECTGVALLDAEDGRTRVVVAGWLDPHRWRSGVSALAILINGTERIRVPAAQLGPGWPDPAPGPTPWRIELAVDDVSGGSAVGVYACPPRGEPQPLGVRVVAAPRPEPLRPDVTEGSLDLPKPGDELHIAAFRVAGWVHLHGAGPDRVDVYIDDAPPQRVRHAIPRADLPGLDRRFTSGFDGVVSLPLHRTAGPVTVRVRAVGVHGGVWDAEPVTVHYAPPGLLDSASVHAPAPIELPVASRQARSGRPRVVVFTHSLRLGGGQLYLQQLLLRLNASGRADILLVSPEDGALRAELEAAGVAVHITRGYATHPQYFAGSISEFGVLIRAWQADAVLVNTLGAFPAIHAAALAGVPSVWTVHESFELATFEYLNWGPHGLNPRVSTAMRDALAVADAVVFEARSTLELHRRAVPSMRGRVVPYGILADDVLRYVAATSRADARAAAGIEPDERVLLCVGVFEPRKAIAALVAAFDDATRHRPKTRLVLIGAHPAEYSDLVREMIQCVEAADRITALDILPDVYPWYRLADVMVSASDIESLPRSMLQAMTFGLPIVTTDTFGTTELVIDGWNGFLCEANSHTALVAALDRVMRLSDSELAEMGRRSREHVEALGGQNYDRDIADLVDELIAEREQASDG